MIQRAKIFFVLIFSDIFEGLQVCKYNVQLYASGNYSD